jgi:hypothetical protein
VLGYFDPKWLLIIVVAITCAAMVFFAFDLPAILIPEDK